MRHCPYCDEEIRTEAIRCRHCRSRLTAFDPSSWYRDMPDRRVAGVAAAVAHACAIPVTAARFAFLVLTPFHLIGAIAYGALWLLVPFRPGEEPPFGRFVRVARRLVDEVRDAVFARRGQPSSGRGPANGAGSQPPHDDVPVTGVPC